MPDLLAGSIVNANDTPPTVADAEVASFTFTHTTFAVTGEPATCGVVFVAPTTGRVTLDYSCNEGNSTAASVLVAPAVREGGSIGSGTTVLAANDDDAVAILTVAGMNSALVFGGRTRLVTGLTPGSTYNVRLEHRTNTGTATVSRRSITVSPAT